MRGFEATSGVPDEDRPRSRGRLLGLSSSGDGNSNAALENDPTRESRGRLPAWIGAIEARARSAETEEPPKFPDPTIDPPPSEEGAALIPFLIRGHRAAVGPHGETVWEPTFAPRELVPLLPPSEGWEAVERFLLPSLPLSVEDPLRVASSSGGVLPHSQRTRERGPPLPGSRDVGKRGRAKTARERPSASTSERSRAPVASGLGHGEPLRRAVGLTQDSVVPPEHGPAPCDGGRTGGLSMSWLSTWGASRTSCAPGCPVREATFSCWTEREGRVA